GGYFFCSAFLSPPVKPGDLFRLMAPLKGKLRQIGKASLFYGRSLFPFLFGYLIFCLAFR
ncbi:hypothetical protein, partial [uncultured Neglectibacter sp.]|uniref:hypothetical protein n=1 Tax=uncultured Neglectibacter sp. TaxID=1924108 RepID=UPI0034DFBE9B